MAWFTGADDAPRVQVALSRDGGQTFSAPIRIDAGSPLGRANVQRLEDGSTAVSWLEKAGDGAAEVRVRRVTPDGKLGRPVIVGKTVAGRSAGFPQIIRMKSNLVVAWRTNRIRVAMLSLAGL